MRFHRIALSLLALVASTAAFAEDAEKHHRPSKGDIPPPYVGRQLGGPEIRLDAEPGKAYVVSFWASWCGPCMQELPILANIQHLAGDRVTVVAVNVEDRDVYRKLQGLIKQTGLTPAYDPDHKAQDAYGVNGIPHMVIVGRDGRITSVRVGYASSSLDELAKQLNEALAVAPAAKASEAKGG